MHFIPGLRLKVSERVESHGIDDSSIGEYAYDYVGMEPNPDVENHREASHESNYEMKEQQRATPALTAE
jgi:ammonium transporter, Amt family